MADHVFPRSLLVAAMAGIVPQPVPTMTSPQMINLTSLIDDAKCYELIRHHRWPDGVRCTSCSSAAVIRHGHDKTQRHRQRYLAIYRFPPKNPPEKPRKHNIWCMRCGKAQYRVEMPMHPTDRKSVV